MLPSACMVLDSLPVTPGGKIDQKALPTPVLTRSRADTTPRTPTEKRVAEIWSEILEIKPIGVDDNFFDLGGHSLLAIRIISRIRESFSLEILLNNLFEEPTVRALASSIETILAVADRPVSRPGGCADDMKEGKM